MGITDMIAGFIRDMLDSEDGQAELQRSQLAQQFGCVPSQINYVIATRFSPEHGYVVESRRGGGGYIRIRQVEATPDLLIMHTVNTVGAAITPADARVFLQNLLSARALEGGVVHLMAAALSDRALAALPPEHRDTARAGIFKQMLLAIV